MEVSVWLAGIPPLSGFFGASWKASKKLVCGLQEAPGTGQGFQDLEDLDAEGLLALAGRHPQ